MKYLLLCLLIPLILLGDSRDAISKKISNMTFQEYKEYIKTDEFKTYESNRKAHQQTDTAQILNKPKIYLITTTTCPYCTKAKKYLDRNRIKYQQYDANSAQGSSLYSKNNGGGVPMLIVGDKVVRGFSEEIYRSLVQ
jgi:glutaredoxin